MAQNGCSKICTRCIDKGALDRGLGDWAQILSLPLQINLFTFMGLNSHSERGFDYSQAIFEY